MRGTSSTAFYGSWVLALALALAATLFFATLANAQSPEQKSAEFQYEELEAPSGPLAGIPCLGPEDADGVVGPGDVITLAGSFAVSPGASIVLQDTDGTQGTLIDGVNAEIAAVDGIEVSVTGEPVNVVGGDKVLSDVCDSAVASTGIAADEADDGGAVVSVLPETGGSMTLIYAAILLFAGVGLALLRRSASRR